MITNEQAVELYELAQLGDNREVPPINKLKLWRAVAQQGGWTYEQGFRAIIEHRSENPGVYFEPGHISQRVAAVRAQIRNRWYCPDPPRHLADDPLAEIAWRRQSAEDFMQRNLAHWVVGEPLELSTGGEIENVKRGELPEGGDSAAMREALALVRSFTNRRRVPNARVSPEDSAAAGRSA